jgi:hypothetical protein
MLAKGERSGRKGEIKTTRNEGLEAVEGKGLKEVEERTPDCERQEGIKVGEGRN